MLLFLTLDISPVFFFCHLLSLSPLYLLCYIESPASCLGMSPIATDHLPEDRVVRLLQTLYKQLIETMRGAYWYLGSIRTNTV